ncbi:somatostatin receptor type 5-like [Branchiostoma lanceolatum]|uniref:somatostatin receptor type 5-like n=1 Tax=Branchiostoma lanceolatum TaxID=7740 RepID=UPI00345627C7
MTDTVDVIRCLLCSSGMAANLLIASIVARYPTMRTACNVYVANLAAADFFFCLLALIQSIVSIRSSHSETLYLRLLEDFCSNIWSELNLTIANRKVTNHTSPYMMVENCTGQYEMFEEYCVEDELNSTSTIRNVSGYTDPYVTAENCTWQFPSAAMLPSLQQAELDYTNLSWTYERGCDISRVILVFLASTSIILLTVIAVERHKAITDPLSNRRHGTVKHAGKICAVVWLVSALAAAIDTVARNVVTNDWTFTGNSLHSGASCVILRLESSGTTHPFFAIILLDFLFGYVLPMCIIIPLYVRILVKVRQSRRLAERATRSDDQAFLMVFVVTVLFLINWLPFHIISLLIHMFVSNEKYDTIGVALSFAVFNSVANPFLYALLGRNFRDKVKKIFCCKQWWKSKQWRPKGGASPDTTLTTQVIDARGHDIRQVRAIGGKGQTQAIGGTKQTHVAGGTKQTQTTCEVQEKSRIKDITRPAAADTGQVTLEIPHTRDEKVQKV